MKRKELISLIFVIPALAAIFALTLYPILRGIDISLTDKLLSYDKYSYIGLENYINILKDDMFWLALQHTAVITIISSIIILILSLALALLLNMKFPLRKFFRGILMIPWVVPSVVSVLIFRWIYNDYYGYINYILVKYHILDQAVNILADEKLAWLGVIIPIVWKEYPFAMLIFLASLQSIDKNLYEAAKIDGASRLQVFKEITLPLLKPAFVILGILEIIWMFSSFDTIFLLTRGGPDNSTITLSIYTYMQAFESTEFGYGSALATIMFLILFAVSIVYFIFVNRESWSKKTS
ncbi:carbohydrate ABC transporter permease [Syntrophomonas wolfei]|uniref:ABC sugar transporter, inner membrane subunit n=1 Tax=Syntrophomonas wolfei subsp. wolfei (strain DSM 2245B / Goettingen) TaxID=335541 RepID=Q0AZW2_SYNWW|nr:sugar ABC transporter permease [Syntrophomonas wolfei]ABI67742.1 ABC sugar transporter, inner membrane subunit [Syntrophomonas wolfei subsp. wolfei str. Goettingen G311]